MESPCMESVHSQNQEDWDLYTAQIEGLVFLRYVSEVASILNYLLKEPEFNQKIYLAALQGWSFSTKKKSI